MFGPDNVKVPPLMVEGTLFVVSNGSTNDVGEPASGAEPGEAFRVKANAGVSVADMRGASLVDTTVTVFVTVALVPEALSVTWNVNTREVPGKSPVLRNVTACNNSVTRAGVASAFKLISNKF